MGLGVVVVLVAFLAVAMHHSDPKPPPLPPPAALVDPSLSPADYPARLLAMRINDPDFNATQQGISCSTATGMYTSRCVVSFTDAERYNQTDEVVIYIVTNDSDFAALQSQIKATLQQAPNSNTVSFQNSATMSDSAGHAFATINYTCEQEISSEISSYAVCLTHYAPGIAVATAVFPTTSLDGMNLSNPPDLNRAEMLQGLGISAINEAIGVK